MKIIVAILFVISTVSATGQSRRFRPNPTIISLLDALQYTCTDILTGLKHLNYFSQGFGDLKMVLQPICTLFQDAGGPYKFDATKFCNFVGDDLQLGDLDLMHFPGVGLESKIYFAIRIVANITRNLYGMDLSDPTTICPHANRLFQPPLLKVLKEYSNEGIIELINAITPEIKSICQNWKRYLASLGVPYDSPYQQLVGSLLDIASEIIDFPIYEQLCKEMKPLFGRDYAGRRRYLNMMKDEL